MVLELILLNDSLSYNEYKLYFMKKITRLTTTLFWMMVLVFTYHTSNAQRGRRGNVINTRQSFYSNHLVGKQWNNGHNFHNRIFPYGRIYRLPSSYIRISHLGNPYFFNNGLFYRPYGNYYGLVAPPLGLTLGMLPSGYWNFRFRGFPYYYYSGVFYKPTDNQQYQVVAPPAGAEVPNLPKDAKIMIINNQKFYEYLGTFYKETTDQNGSIKYIVQGTDGVLNTNYDSTKN
jgi:hypothetical protein